MIAVAKGEADDETLEALRAEKKNLIKKFRVADGHQRLELKKAIEEINKKIRVKMA